jgi:hypothetical protein
MNRSTDSTEKKSIIAFVEVFFFFLNLLVQNIQEDTGIHEIRAACFNREREAAATGNH